jgi:hypothetical protein
VKTSAENPMTELRQILEAIARDEEAYPRDRIAAVRALAEMACLRRVEVMRRRR